ncbi:MAG TPA: carbohydrate ABC transporter permease [Thermomicrobiales bacterium]|nr:carbohydrate ABC transporter permease [Thermomicrobiales bacterium]HRA48784.1 carbohydrate ABC transporter permease [Thermomicrobiales bacterium]
MVRSKAIRGILVWLAIAGAVIWTLAPFAWAISASLKTGTNVYNNEWIPFLQFEPSLRSWKGLLALPVLKQAMATSAIVSLSVATICVLLAAPAAYGISRLPWSANWQRGFLASIMIQRVLPPVTFITPFMLLGAFFGVKDTLPGLIIVDVVFMLPLAVIIAYSAFAAVPHELVESASIDGASAMRTFLQIATPLTAPALMAAWILCLAFTWNEWLYADFMTFNKVETMSVALITVVGGGSGANVPQAVARTLSMMVVPMIAALASQRFIVSGLSMGAVKG